MNCRDFLPLLFVLSCFLWSREGSAQVILNEVCASNLGPYVDNYNEPEDWFELYNADAAPVDISGYYLSDKLGNPTKWQIPAGVTIPGHGYRVVFASGRGEFAGGVLHTGFKLTQTKGEYVVLADPAGNVLQSFHFEKPTQLNHSYGLNAQGTWRVFSQSTPTIANTEANFAGYAPKPVMSQPAGFYNGPITLQLYGPSGSVVRYTTDGTEPIPTSPQYTDPVAINSTTVVRAKVFSSNPDLLPSFIETNTYFINEPHTVPVISIAGDQLGQLLSGGFIDPTGALEYFEDGQLIDEAVGEFNKHGNDSWAYAQRGIDYITRDQMGYKDAIDHQIFPTVTDRDEFQRLILKAAANDNYPFQAGGAHIRDAYVHTLAQRAHMELDERSYTPCVLYLNGNYWGIYEIREKADDDDYTSYYYDQDEFNIDYIKTWGATWQEYGSWADWYPLHDFITNNDMSVPANYDYVKERLNVLSLVDYMVINTHVVCKDWLNWNTAWWRGRNPEGQQLKWRYTLWDLDATFDHYINYTGIPDSSPNSDPCDNETYSDSSDPQGHVDLITSLMANPDFHALYVNRYADMNNVYFTCDYMIGLLDSLVAAIEPEMPAHVARWGGSVQEWLVNVQEIRDFIHTRCTVIDNGIMDCYEVTGPYPIEVRIQPATSPNKVQVNTITPDIYPFFGDYFGDIPITLTARPATGWEFNHWQVANHVFGPNQYAEAIQLSLITNDVITAWFEPDVPCATPFSINITPSMTTAALDWSGPSNSISYEIRWRPAGSNQDWEVDAQIDPMFTITGLNDCTPYELQVRAICGNALSTYVTQTFTTACVNGTEESATVEMLNIYPNPFRDAFTLDFALPEAGPVNIVLYNAAGAVLDKRSWELLAAGPNQLRWDFSEGFSAGVYMIQIQTERGVVTRRVVKQ